MQLFLHLLPLGLAAPLLPWVLLSPALATWQERRTTKALDTLVANMVDAASLDWVFWAPPNPGMRSSKFTL